MIQPQSPEDLILWPDGTACYRHELEDMLQGRSDDFEVVPVSSPRWDTLVREAE